MVYLLRFDGNNAKVLGTQFKGLSAFSYVIN